MADADGRDDGPLRFELGWLRKKAIREQRLSVNTVFTCDSCTRRDICVSAFDAYNTDGDCLEDK